MDGWREHKHKSKFIHTYIYIYPHLTVCTAECYRAPKSAWACWALVRLVGLPRRVLRSLQSGRMPRARGGLGLARDVRADSYQTPSPIFQWLLCSKIPFSYGLSNFGNYIISPKPHMSNKMRQTFQAANPGEPFTCKHTSAAGLRLLGKQTGLRPLVP